MSEGSAAAGWASASFRDTRGRVCVRGGRILRMLSPLGAEDWQALNASPAWAALQRESMVVRTWEPTDVQPEPPAVAVLEHAPVSFVSYPFEWPFSLLKDAALLYLHLLQKLLPAGFTLVDGTSRNILFEGLQPIFIDVLSMAPRRGGVAWLGFNQFLETMAYPLMLTAHKRISYHAWLRGSPDLALPVAEMGNLLGWADSLRPGVMTLVKLRRLLERVSEREDIDGQLHGIGAMEDPDVVMHTVKRLETVINRLKPQWPRSFWSSYEKCIAMNYGDEAHRLKQGAVDTFVRRAATGGIVWDLGCNTGEYSAIAAQYARLVVAVDGDHAVADAVCELARTRQLRNVLPLVADVAWPSPSLGWNTEECRGLWSRGPADLVLALALGHHVVLGRHVPCEMLLETIARLGRHCVFEFIDPEDPQAERMAQRLGPGYQTLPPLPDFEAMCASTFSIEDVRQLTRTRAVYMLRSRVLA
jgi:hypothetical protein